MKFWVVFTGITVTKNGIFWNPTTSISKVICENIYLKKEDNFRKHHEILKIEYNNYTQNFKYLKEQAFELVLQIMKKEKEKKLLAK